MPPRPALGSNGSVHEQGERHVNTMSETAGAAAAIEVPRRLLIGSAASVAVGSLIAAAGMVVAAAALAATGRRWMAQLEKPPMVTAQEQWHKLGTGIAAGARAWKDAAA
jgi:hypothetical protein